jgi:hypothetical protein
VLFACGAVVDLCFLSLETKLGGGAFVVFAVLAALSGVYVVICLPETKGRSLPEVQALLATSTLLPSWMLKFGRRQPYLTFDHPLSHSTASTTSSPSHPTVELSSTTR